jgi:hypothetical protein
LSSHDLLLTTPQTCSLFGWLVADGWCWFVLRAEYCWLVAGGWFVLREKCCWLVADKPSEQAGGLLVKGPLMSIFFSREVYDLSSKMTSVMLHFHHMVGLSQSCRKGWKQATTDEKDHRDCSQVIHKKGRFRSSR